MISFTKSCFVSLIYVLRPILIIELQLWCISVILKCPTSTVYHISFFYHVKYVNMCTVKIVRSTFLSKGSKFKIR